MPLNNDEYLCEKLISFLPEKSVPECDSIEDVERRPKKKARASKFDDDEDLYDGGELLFGFNLPPVKTEVQFIKDIDDGELSPDNQLQVVPNNVAWKPTAEWKESLKESVNIFNSRISTRPSTTENDYDLMLKELQSDPTFEHYMEKFIILWRSINRIDDKQAHDDSLIFITDKCNLLKTKRDFDMEQAAKVVKLIRRDQKKARQAAKEELTKEGFVYKKRRTLRRSHHTPAVASPMSEEHIQPPKSHEVVIETQYESDTDRDDDVEGGTSSGGSVIDEDFAAEWAPQVALQEEMIVDASPEQPDSVSDHMASSLSPDLYKNIPEAVIKRGIALNNNTPQLTQSTSNAMMLDQVANEELITNAKRLNESSKVEPIRSLKRKASEELQNEDSKRKFERDASGEIITAPEKSTGLSRDEYAAAMQMAHDKPVNSNKDLDDDIICIDEDSDRTPITRDASNEGLIWYSNTRKKAIWRMRNISSDVLPKNTYVQRFAAYNLPPLDSNHFVTNREPRNDENPMEIPLISQHERSLPQIKRRNNEDRCCIFLDLGLKDRNVREVAIYKSYPGLSIEDQLFCNDKRDLTDSEKDYSASHVIPQYGSVPVGNFKFPTADPYEGLYWPIFQPIDDIPMDDSDTIYNADVQNQIVNQTICNYVAKRNLLCDDGSGFWETSYKEGCSVYDNEQRKGPKRAGRFTNRVCFARNLPSKETETRNQRAKENNKREDEKYREEIERQKEIQKQKFLSKYGKEEHEVLLNGTCLEKEQISEYRDARLSTTLSSRVRSSQRDTYTLSSDHYLGRRKPRRYPSAWFEVKDYVPANDRRTFLCTYINYYNKSIVEIMPNPQNTDVHNERYLQAIANWTAGAFTAAFAFQYDKYKRFSRISQGGTMSHFQLSEKRRRFLEEKFSRGATIKLKDLEALCKMEPWELEYWPLIWDSLSSIYKKMPPLSHLVPFIRDEIDAAFNSIAKADHRREYFSRYTARKNSYLQD